MNPKKSPYTNGFHSLQLRKAFQNGQVHIVAPAVCGKSNYPVAVSYHDSNDPLQTEAAKQAFQIAELANLRGRCRSLLPDLPLTAMPAHKQCSGCKKEYGRVPAAEIIRRHLLQVFEIHLEWIRDLWINQHRMVVPSIYFAFDQPQAFEIETCIHVLRKICNNEEFFDFHESGKLCSLFDIYYSVP